MKKFTTIAMIAIANFALASCSFAQTHAVKANIPFDFTIQGQLLPAGTYVIKSDSGHLIDLQNLDKSIQVLGLAMPDSAVTRGQNKLMFRRYGGQYFLRQIVSEEAGMDLRLPVSKQEQKARAHETKVQEASTRSSSQIYVAAR